MFEPDDLLLTLTNAQVEFVVIGGIAVGVHGFVRATKDLDIVPDPSPENLERLAHVLVEIGAQHVGVGDFSPEEFSYDPTDPVQLAEGANFRLETSLGPMDIMQWVAGIETHLAYSELAPKAFPVTFRDTQIRVCAIEHLRAMKRAAGRPQDLEDLKRLGEG
jgi:microsomal dipeptidase-like Zn-dependent dipeptidase